MMDIVKYIESKWHLVSIVDSVDFKYSRQILIQKWNNLPDGVVLLMFNTNPETYNQSVKNTVYKTIHQIDGPPKFTYENITVIRKTGELKLSDGVIEWEGFDLMREAILHLVTWDEAIKIIDGWK